MGNCFKYLKAIFGCSNDCQIKISTILDRPTEVITSSVHGDNKINGHGEGKVQEQFTNEHLINGHGEGQTPEHSTNEHLLNGHDEDKTGEHSNNECLIDGHGEGEMQEHSTNERLINVHGEGETQEHSSKECLINGHGDGERQEHSSKECLINGHGDGETQEHSSGERLINGHGEGEMREHSTNEHSINGRGESEIREHLINGHDEGEIQEHSTSEHLSNRRALRLEGISALYPQKQVERPLGSTDDYEGVNVSNIQELSTPPKSTVGHGEECIRLGTPPESKVRHGESTPPKSTVGHGEECISLFDLVKDTTASNIDDLIHSMIKELREKEKSKQKNKPDNISTSSQVTEKIEEKRRIWKSFSKSGSKFLIYLNQHIEKMDNKEDLHEGTKVVIEMLQQLEKPHWVVAGLSMIAYLLSKIKNVSENRTECLELLGYMIDLVQHLKNLKNMSPEEEEKFTSAIQLIVKGSITCASKLHSKKHFRFIKTSVNSEALSSLRGKINELYPDFVFTTVIETTKPMEEKVRRRYFLPMAKPVYPDKKGYYTDEDTKEH